MPVYQYKAKNPQGKSQSGNITAKSVKDAKLKLLKRRLKVSSLKASTEGDELGITPILGTYLYLDGGGKLQINPTSSGPNIKDLTIFSKQFSTMIGSGIPLIQSLNILAKQQENLSFRIALFKIKKDIEEGKTLALAMAEHPKIFDTLYISMVKAGEVSGNLDNIMKRLVTYIEKSAKIKGQIKSALMYPSVVVVVAIAVVAALLIFVIPTFAEQYSQMGRELPGVTQALIDLSNDFVENWTTYFGSLFAGIAAIFLANKTEKGKRLFDQIMLKLPVIGSLLNKLSIGRFCSTLSTMLVSGVDLLEAIKICAATSGNVIIEEFIMNARVSLEKGKNLSQPLAEGTLVPDMVVSMIAVGEETGALDEMLAKVSEFYEEEVDTAVAGLLSMIEPIMIVAIGGVIGTVVVALYLPIFEMAGG